MATQPLNPGRPAVRRPRRSTPGSSSIRKSGNASVRSRSIPPEGFTSPRSVDLAGRAVAIAPAVPPAFDQPLARHHKLVGHWVASREPSSELVTRAQARRRIAEVFEAEVAGILAPITFVELRVVVLEGGDLDAPAIAIVCDSMGQLDLGWIETSEAPAGWRAAAYSALEQMLGRALPIFTYHDLFEEFSMCYWEGSTDDDDARHYLVAHCGLGPAELEEATMPSEMNARRPDWMLRDNALDKADLPPALDEALCTMEEAYDALGKAQEDRNAWHFDTETLWDYLPGLDECASLPPLTLVPVDIFRAEVDDVGQRGMEMGFMDVAGLVPLPDPARVTDWFATLRAGAQFLHAAQTLIQLNPETL